MDECQGIGVIAAFASRHIPPKTKLFPSHPNRFKRNPINKPTKMTRVEVAPFGDALGLGKGKPAEVRLYMDDAPVAYGEIRQIVHAIERVAVRRQFVAQRAEDRHQDDPGQDPQSVAQGHGEADGQDGQSQLSQVHAPLLAGSWSPFYVDFRGF